MQECDRPDSGIVPSKFSGRLIIHVGPHKTGTTTVQHFWQGNPDLLRRDGCLYPQGGRDPAVPIQHWALGEAMLQRDISRINRMIAEIDRELSVGPFATLLISSEILSRKAVQACHLRLLCDAFPDATRQWVVVLRRQDELLLSLYSEHLKHSLIRYPDSYRKLSVAEHMDHVRRLELIAAASPLDEILVARFDDIKSDLVGNFNRMLGLDVSASHPAEGEQALNVSIPGKALRILRYLNALPMRVAKPIRGRFIGFSHRHRRWFGGAAIAPARVAAVQRQFLPGNLAIEQALFPDVDSCLVGRRPDYPLDPVPLSANLTTRLRGWEPKRGRFVRADGQSTVPATKRAASPDASGPPS